MSCGAEELLLALLLLPLPANVLLPALAPPRLLPPALLLLPPPGTAGVSTRPCRYAWK